MNNLGNLIVTHRILRGLTQSALAKKLGVSAQYLGRVEKGAIPFSTKPKREAALISALGIKKELYFVAREKDYSVWLRGNRK
jgi:transcriptional regulator with XRE-family HTH domain